MFREILFVDRLVSVFGDFILFHLILFCIFTKQRLRDRQTSLPTVGVSYPGSRLTDVDRKPYQANEQEGPAAEMVKH